MANSDSTSDTIQIQLNKGYVTVVDAQDADEYLKHPKWSARIKRNSVYVARSTKPFINRIGTTEYLHIVIFERVLGRKLVKGEKVDHINGDGLDNRRGNLRLATHAQNIRNSKLSRSNKTGYKGVMVVNGLIRAKITVDAKSLDLGSYETILDAAVAYNIAAVEYFGEYARLNPIDNWQGIKPKKHERVRPDLKQKAKSGYSGVYPDGNRWTAKVQKNHKIHRLGAFSTAEEAYIARQNYIKEHNL